MVWQLLSRTVAQSSADEIGFAKEDRRRLEIIHRFPNILVVEHTAVNDGNTDALSRHTSGVQLICPHVCTERPCLVADNSVPVWLLAIHANAAVFHDRHDARVCAQIPESIAWNRRTNSVNEPQITRHLTACRRYGLLCCVPSSSGHNDRHILLGYGRQSRIKVGTSFLGKWLGADAAWHVGKGH